MVCAICRRETERDDLPPLFGEPLRVASLAEGEPPADDVELA